MNYSRLVSICVLALSLLGASLPTSWNGVALGFPVTGLRLNFGDPLRVLSFDDGTENVARYWIPGANSTYFLVVERHGYIVAFDAFTDTAPDKRLDNVPPDPSGVRLGDSLAQAKQKHPDFQEGATRDGLLLVGKASPTVGIAYTFANNRVRSMHWSTTLKPGLPDEPRLTLPSADTAANAILVVQQNERDGVDWEYRFLTFHPCAQGSQWRVQSQSLQHSNGRAYDVLEVACPATKASREFYFDVTSYFGKM